jgi:hypothetical protein
VQRASERFAGHAVAVSFVSQRLVGLLQGGDLLAKLDLVVGDTVAGVSLRVEEALRSKCLWVSLFRSSRLLARGRRCPDCPTSAAEADRTAATAVEADFEIVGVGDQTVRTERSAVLVTSGRFAAGAAACAFFDAGVGDAGAADALPVERFVCPDDATAAGACRPDDPGNALRGEHRSAG